MIAPLRPTETRQSPKRRSFVEARRAIAAALLRGQEMPATPRLVSHWKAWAIAAWMAGIALTYVATLIGPRLF
ncbi:MAG: hypothetical protein KF708_04535 [Pirellulales bacterium]|nr:hypothetical protein [Pirellulales bacterium]